MKASPDIRRYHANRQAEIESATLYRAMAAGEPRPEIAEIYRRLAAVEDRHAGFWEERLRAADVPVSPPQPGGRTRLLVWLARRLGPQWVLPMIAAAERRDQGMYDDQPEARSTAMSADERSHARVLNLMNRTLQGGAEGGVVARLEGRHRTIGGNALRAAVLGSADGLVSNLSLVMGVAGAQMSSQTVLITGLAGLLAGASSMAIGEWISVQSSRELNQRQLEVEAEELEVAPAEEQEELALIYQAKGLSKEQAQAVAARLMEDKDKALDTLAREELGIDPADLGGSAWVAAFTSFGLFAAGAFLPVAPFLFLAGTPGVIGSILCGGLGLFGVGAAITLVTGRPVLYSGLRQLLFGLAAAALTYGIGRLIGVTLAG